MKLHLVFPILFNLSIVIITGVINIQAKFLAEEISKILEGYNSDMVHTFYAVIFMTCIEFIGILY